MGAGAGARAEEPLTPTVAWPGLCPQGFTYVAPSVLDSIKEAFSFQPKLRSPRRLNSSPRTPVRYRGGAAGSSCGPAANPRAALAVS